VTFCLGCWLIGFPLVAAALTEHSAWLNYAVLGALLIPVVVLGLVLLRVIAWVFLNAYWTIQAVVATLLLVALAAIAVLVLLDQDVVLVASEQVVTIQRIALLPVLRAEPGRVPTTLFLFALLLLATNVLVLIAVRWIARRVQSGRSAAHEPPAPQVRALEKKPLTYLEHRNTKS
jgi:hypothetical protein